MELSDREGFARACLSKSPKSLRELVVASCERVFDKTFTTNDENNNDNSDEESMIEDGVQMILLESARLNARRDELERTLKEEIFFLAETETEGELLITIDTLVDSLYPFVKRVQKTLKETEEEEGNGGREISGGIKRLESCDVRVDAVVAEKKSSEFRVRLENRWHFAEEDKNGMKRRSELKFACSEDEGKVLSNALKEALRAAENARL